MSRRFFYSVRLFAGCFPFTVARILFESQKQVWNHEIHYLHFFVSIRGSYSLPCYLFRVFRVFRG